MSFETMVGRGFLVVSVVVGGVLCAVVLGIRSINKDIGEIAVVASIFVYHAINEKLEKLRPRLGTEPEITVEIPRMSFLHLLLVIAVFVGLQLTFGFLSGVALRTIDIDSTKIEPQAILFIPLNCAADFVGGYLIAKTVPAIPIVYVPVAVLFTYVMFLTTDLRSALTAGTLPILVLVWVLYIVCAIAGVRAGHAKKHIIAAT